jgi:hypothetical protein
MGTRRPLAKCIGSASLSLLLCVALPTSGRSTTVRQLDLPELVQQAEIIADVTVTGIQSYWASPGNAIHTHVTFSLNQAPMKGHVPSSFVLDFLGGTVGDRKMEVSGMPKLQVGDRLILFSYGPDKTFVSPMIGFDQGALRVVRDQLNNVDRVYRWWGQPVNESQPFTSRVPVSAAITTPEQLPTASSVEEFLKRISKMVHQ